MVRIKIEGDMITISTEDGGQIVMSLDALLEFETAVASITNLYAISKFHTFEVTIK